MRPWTVGLVVAAGLAACKKDKDTRPPEVPLSRGDGSALWVSAPAGTTSGLVIAPGALGDAHRAVLEVVRRARPVPRVAGVLERVTGAARAAGVDIASADGFAKAGIDTGRGAAVFLVGTEPYIIAPVSDRDAFRRTFGGVAADGVDRFAAGAMVCAPEGAHYRCAASADRLAAWRPASDHVDGDRPDDLRGSIEFRIDGALAGGSLGALVPKLTAIVGAIAFEPGGATARVAVRGSIDKRYTVGATPLADKAKKRKPAGLLVAKGRPLIDGEIASWKSIDEPIVGSLTPRSVLDALTGELVAYAPAGGPGRGFIELGIQTPEPFRALADLCPKLSTIQPQLSAERTRAGCRLTLRRPLAEPVYVSLDISETALLISAGDVAAGRDGSIAVVPGELASETWLAAVWARGSVLGVRVPLEIPPDQLETFLEQIPELALGLWAYGHLSEIGAGLRIDGDELRGFVRVATTWRNAREVVDQVEPLVARYAAGDIESSDPSSVAAKYPGSPLATDVKLGAGAAASTAVVVLTAAAIPAFLTYIKKSKSTEARQLVKAMYDGARAYHAQNGAFPPESTAITPPAGSCCQHPDDTCPANPALWTGETWRQLRFSVDHPHYYSYQYERAADGDSFTVRALGDLDCDGELSTFEMVGTTTPDADGPGLYRENELE